MKTIYKISLIIILVAGMVYSAIPSDTQTWIRVGSLNSQFQAWGAERGWNANLSRYIGLQWPSWYDKTDNFVIDRQFMACKNFTGADGVEVGYKSVKFSNGAGVSQITPQILVQTTRYPACAITVDGVEQVSEGEVISELHSATESPADRVVTNVVRTGMGVTMTRKVYAFSRLGHDNYNIIEYTFENTGNIDDDDSLEINGTIHDFYFGMMSRYCTSREAYYVTNLRQASWGAHQWVHHTPMTDDPDLPYYYSWMGQAQTRDITLTYDNIGVPVLPDEAPLDEARIRCPQFAGTAVLHSDQANDNEANDKSKVRMGWYIGDDIPAEEADQQVWTLLNDNYQGLGQVDTAQDVYAGHKIADRLAPYSVIVNQSTAGTNSYMSFGPYEIPYGESIKIVICEGVSGLSREKAKEVGQNWYKAYQGDPVDLLLPPSPVYRDPEPVAAGADSMDIYKDMWVYTGKDSIIKTFYQAKNNYDSGFNIPLPPPPPLSFNINSQADRVVLEWADNPSTDPDFEGYRIYRAKDLPSAEYQLIFECSMGDSNIVNTYSDRDCELGYRYYYYVTSYSVDVVEGVIESGRAYTQTTMAAGLGLLAPSGEGTEEDPYKISILENLLWLSMNRDEWDKYYVQTTNINVSGTAASDVGFAPIGDATNVFTGVYDGQGYLIDSLFIQRNNEDQIGLFGRTDGALIHNLGLTNVQISGANDVGGLVGQNNSSIIHRCYVSGSINGTNYVGGITGKNLGSFIDQCYTLAAVTGDEYVGGLSSHNSGTIYCSYSTGAVTGNASVGGLIGINTSTVKNSFWDTQISGQSISAGGTGKTSAEMKTLSTYIQTEWDLANIWTYHADRNQGYPYLLNQKVYGFKVIGLEYILNHSATIVFAVDTSVASYGICWNTSGEPTTNDGKADGGIIDFTGNIIAEANGLSENTYYFIRAFQSDTGSVSYSNTIVLKTIVFAEEGTMDDPYCVADSSQLKWVNDNPSYWNKHYIQTADINANTISSSYGSEGWSPIGYSTGGYLSRPFTGSYNGQGYFIDEMHIDRNTDNVGLFGYVIEADLKNIMLTNVNITGKYYTGGIAGYITMSTLNRCHSTGTIVGEHYAGGLIGFSGETTVSECHSSANLDVSRYAGGLIAKVVDGTISNCYACGSVDARVYPGGLISRVSDASIVNNYSRGNVIGGRGGGLIGNKNDDTNVSASFWDKQTSEQAESDGGIGKTSSAMKDIMTYYDAGWTLKTDDEDGIWNINSEVNDGYPVLSYLYPDLPVPVLSSIGDPIPVNYSLEANYPNPFNPVTTLQYALPEQVDVRMMIYNIAGHKVQEWSYVNQTAGTYNIVWNSIDMRGNSVPSGVYIYRMVAGEFVESKKMVLMK